MARLRERALLARHWITSALLNGYVKSSNIPKLILPNSQSYHQRVNSKDPHRQNNEGNLTQRYPASILPAV
jgi:hypothetical protein